MTATSSTSQSTVPPTISMSSNGPASDAGNFVNVAGTLGHGHAGLLGVAAVVQPDGEHLARCGHRAAEVGLDERRGAGGDAGGEVDERGPVVVDAHRVGTEAAAGRVVRRRRSSSSRTSAARPSWLASFMWWLLRARSVAEVGAGQRAASAAGRRRRGAVEVEVGSLQRAASCRARRTSGRTAASGSASATTRPPIDSNHAALVRDRCTSTSASSDDEPPAVAVHVVERPAADLALHELRARRGARSGG